MDLDVAVATTGDPRLGHAVFMAYSQQNHQTALNLTDDVTVFSDGGGKVTAARKPVVVQPIGASEQHGYHLPLNTDNFIVSRLCDAAGAISTSTGYPGAPVKPG
mgnify:CR=1 FL=1